MYKCKQANWTHIHTYMTHIHTYMTHIHTHDTHTHTHDTHTHIHDTHTHTHDTHTHIHDVTYADVSRRMGQRCSCWSSTRRVLGHWMQVKKNRGACILLHIHTLLVIDTGHRHRGYWVTGCRHRNRLICFFCRSFFFKKKGCTVLRLFRFFFLLDRGDRLICFLSIVFFCKCTRALTFQNIVSLDTDADHEACFFSIDFFFEMYTGTDELKDRVTGCADADHDAKI